MILYIDTTQNNLIKIILKGGDKIVAEKKLNSDRTQAEKLLPAILGLLRAKRLKLADLKEIKVANRGGSFTSLRVGVVTANALGYALGLPVAGEFNKARTFGRGKRSFKVVEPLYDREAEITSQKSNTLLPV